MRNLRYAWRSLWRAPGFAAVAIITLALGIGINTAIFSIVGPMLLEPLPFPQPQQIVEIAHRSHGQMNGNLDGAEALYLLAHQRTLAAAAIVEEAGDSNLTSGSTAVRVNAVRTTHGYFGVWGVKPLRGRTFDAADDQPGAARVAVVSYGLWQSQFGGAPRILGHTFRMNDQVFTVIGVMPSSFATPTQNQLNPAPAQLWVDMQPTLASLQPMGPNLDVMARLAPGVTMAQAQANLSALKLGFAQSHPTVAAHVDWGAQSLRDDLAAGSQEPLWLMLGAVGLVLLIACANLANLLLA
ncbi:MAG: ABC transporter permease, partial [Terriglobales bacterium]